MSVSRQNCSQVWGMLQKIPLVCKCYTFVKNNYLFTSGSGLWIFFPSSKASFWVLPLWEKQNNHQDTGKSHQPSLKQKRISDNQMFCLTALTLRKKNARNINYKILMISVLLTQSNIIIQRCKISKKPSAAVLLKCCWDSLLVLQTEEIGDIRLIRAAKEF